MNARRLKAALCVAMGLFLIGYGTIYLCIVRAQMAPYVWLVMLVQALWWLDRGRSYWSKASGR